MTGSQPPDVREALAGARAEIGAIIATSDDGADMMAEIMAGPVAALLAAARGCPSCGAAGGYCTSCGRPL